MVGVRDTVTPSQALCPPFVPSVQQKLLSELLCSLLLAFSSEFCPCQDLAGSQPFTEQLQGNKALKPSTAKGWEPLSCSPLSWQLSGKSCFRAAPLQ